MVLPWFTFHYFPKAGSQECVGFRAVVIKFNKEPTRQCTSICWLLSVNELLESGKAAPFGTALIPCACLWLTPSFCGLSGPCPCNIFYLSGAAAVSCTQDNLSEGAWIPAAGLTFHMFSVIVPCCSCLLLICPVSLFGELIIWSTNISRRKYLSELWNTPRGNSHHKLISCTVV